MAKSLKEQLAGLVGTKKPNVFYKGLNLDADNHIITNEQYIDATNVRLNNKDGNLGSLQNIASTESAGSFALSGWKFFSQGAAGKKWWFQNGVETTNHNLTNIRFEFNDSTGADLINVDVGTEESDFSGGNFGYHLNANDYSHSELILHCYDKLRTNSTFTAVMSVALAPPVNKGDIPALYFFPVDQTKLAGTIVLKSSYGSSTNTVASDSNTYGAVVYTSGDAGTFTLYPVGLVSFRDYIGAICYKSANLNVILKINTNANGTVSSITPVVINDFGITSNTVSLRVEKIEENDNYNRLYWTDGVNPVKTVNLDAGAGFYDSFTESEDFNLFAKSPLPPIEIKKIRNTGNVNCGSWSYCYRLITSDGKLSSFSPISNPLPLLASPTSQDYHTSIGGSIDSSSGKSVHLRVDGISEVYSKIQLIGIQYIDEDGGAAYFIIKEESVNLGFADLVHSGGETTTVITADEVLTSKNTWDVCQDLAVKDNRLLAANLKNNAREIITDSSTFRVKSYKHGAAAADFDTEPGSNSYSTYTGLNNPDLYDDILYKEPATDTTHYRYAEAPGANSGASDSSEMVFGASTPNYHAAGDRNGVYVSFKLKSFDLNKYPLWWNAGGVSSTNVGHQSPPYYGPNIQTFPEQGGGWNNYKNPKFAKKYVGYMRDEIYRFGIQFFDKDGNQTFTYPIGDVRFPPIESDYRFVGTTGAVGDFNATAGAYPTKYILEDQYGNGYILYPEFRIKLHEDVRKNISGFNIVRAERTDADKRVLVAGLMNQTLFHKDDADNHGMKNKVGLDKVAIFSQRTAESDLGTAGYSEMYTLDAPDAMFGAYVYESTGTHQLRIASKLLCKSMPSSSIPTGGPSSPADNSLKFDEDDGGMTSGVTMMRGHASSSTFYAAPIYPDYTTEPDLGDVRKGCWYSVYYCDSSNADLFNASNIGNQQKTILYGQNIGPGGIISSTNYTAAHDQDFVNSCWMYDNGDQLTSISTDSGAYILKSSGNQLHGNSTIFLCMTDGNYFTLNTGVTSGFGDVPVEGQVYEAAKPYAKIINPINADSGIYGGDSVSAFENTRWISTGAYVSINDISSVAGAEKIVSVFGGDTYINKFSISKFHREEYSNDKSYVSTQGVVFPVESSINIDMRHGDFFGKNQANLQKEDEYLYNFTYSAQNNTKSFPAKDSDIKLVTDFRNVIAVSNIKIAGQSEDAFSKFDATEAFEVNANYGGIKNLMTFKDTLYALQENAVSIVSMNTRALIQSEDGSSIAIQSALGTGTVIERNDYISTKHGSQHRMNALTTDRGLYWWDKNLNTICLIDIKSPKEVVDLLASRGCSSFASFLKEFPIYDNPLDITIGSGTEGGYSISYSPFINEIIFSTTLNLGGSMKVYSIAYDEMFQAFTSKRSYANCLPVSHKGYLYSIGFEDTTTVTSTHSNRKTLYLHDKDTNSGSYSNFYGQDGGAPIFRFVNNEELNTLKVYDKISISTTDSGNDKILHYFVFSTNNDDSAVVNIQFNDISKLNVGKHVIPVFAGEGNGRVKGNYLRVEVQQTVNHTTKAFNVFSITSHYRKNLI